MIKQVLFGLLIGLSACLQADSRVVECVVSAESTRLFAVPDGCSFVRTSSDARVDYLILAPHDHEEGQIYPCCKGAATCYYEMFQNDRFFRAIQL